MIAIDFETSWTKDRSIATHGTVGYLRHPETDIFMVSIYDADSGLSYVGDPKDAPWEQLTGQPLCAHNWSFDSAVISECERRGIIPFPLEPKGFCTADLVSYLQMPRALAGAVQVAFGRKLDKSVRDAFKGKDYHTMTIEEKVRIAEYALGDAKDCWLLWKTYHHLWPEHEQALSQHTSMMGQRGIAIDIPKLEEGIRHFKQILFDVEKQVPWAEEEKIMSIPALRAHCLKIGIPAPESTAKGDDTFLEWAEQYGDKAPFIKALARYRSVNRSLNVLEAIQARIVDGRLRYNLVYAGAVPTFRWAGSTQEKDSEKKGSLNMQNLPREPVEGVDIRALLVPAPGKKFVSADMSQIEPRTSAYVTGDTKTLKLMAQGMDAYEAHARLTMDYDLDIPLKEAAKKDPKYAKMRQYAKPRELGMTYEQYARGFQAYAKQYGLTLTLAEADREVKDFRKRKPLLVDFWKKLLSAMKMSRGSTFDLQLPSGRTMRYFDVRMHQVERERDDGSKYKTTELTARRTIGGPVTYYTAGKLHNNVCQGSARDVFGEKILDIEYGLGLPVILTVHDEVLVEVDADKAEEARQQVEDVMKKEPAWMPWLPLASDCYVMDRYEK